MRRFMIVLFLISCAPAHDRKAGVTEVSYAAMKANVFGPKCETCHADYKTYQGVRKSLDRIADRVFVRKDMPPGQPLSAAEFQNLQDWLDYGAPEIQPVSLEKPKKIPADLKWADVKTLILPECLTCHSQPKPEAGLDLSSREDFTKVYLRVLERSVFKSDCPLPPSPALSPAQKDGLIRWIRDGMN